jgi:hypothetical protein
MLPMPDPPPDVTDLEASNSLLDDGVVPRASVGKNDGGVCDPASANPSLPYPQADLLRLVRVDSNLDARRGCPGESDARGPKAKLGRASSQPEEGVAGERDAGLSTLQTDRLRDLEDDDTPRCAGSEMDNSLTELASSPEPFAMEETDPRVTAK